MASSSRRLSNQADWDPMRDDFDNSNYENQHAHDNSSDFVKLNHCRLYITCIPKVLNDDGLRTVFARYGNLTEAFVSKDPLRKFALVTYETPAEARHAMMKLNKTEPLKLNISVAHEKKENRRDNQNNRGHAAGSVGHSSRERDYDTASISSRNKNRKTEDLSNGDNFPGMEEDKDIGDELGLVEPDLQMELEKLKLESLRLQQEELACQKRMLIKQAERRVLVSNQSSNRCVLPNGRVVVKNMTEGNDRRDPENSFAAGAGDSLKIPGLQRAASRACVACGVAADAFCARCGVTPYCSERCQRRDWPARHSAVCHNLARLNVLVDVNDGVVEEPTIPNVPPLRRPHSPAREPARERRDDRDDGSKKFMPPGHNPKSVPCNPRDAPRSYNRQDGQNRSEGQGRQNGTGRQYDRPPRQFNKPDMQKPIRRPQVEDQDWGSKVSASRPEPKSSGDRVEPKSNIPQVSSPPVKEQGESKPPIRGTPTNKAASLEGSSPAKTPIRNTATPLTASPSASNVKPPGDATETTPSSKLVPKNCVIETLSVGDKVYLQVDNSAKECQSGDSGFVCVSLGDSFMEPYQTLCENYTLEDNSPVTATPGDTVSLYNTSEEAWYRARVLSAGRAALLDASKVVPLDPQTKLAPLPPAYALIPEFCCLLQADAKIGDNFCCTLVEKTGRGFKVSLEMDGGATREGEVSRWLPTVCRPAPPACAPTSGPVLAPNAPSAGSKLISLSRPPVSNNSTVLLVHCASGEGASQLPVDLFVRPADARTQRAFDAALHDAMLYGLTATSLSEPPRAGQYVVSKFTDGVHYRAIVRRTSVARDKYQLEYLEFGNIQVNQLQNLYACPPHLTPDQVPVLTSHVALRLGAARPMTPAAETYLEALKEDTELVLTLPNGDKTAPSGAEVILTVAKNKDCVNKRVEELCTPEWLALQQRGGDVVDVEPAMYSELTWLELEPAGGEMTVLDVSAIHNGLLSACPAAHPHKDLVLGSLTQRMNAYCESELGREPYLPKTEELCLAQLPPYSQWFRAVVVSHSAGAAEAEVNYIDYGTVERVPVAQLRKMLREFVVGLPALASTLIIRGFPNNPSVEQLASAAQFMNMNEDGMGTLRITNVRPEGSELPGLYDVDAPGLLEAMGS